MKKTLTEPDNSPVSKPEDLVRSSNAHFAAQSPLAGSNLSNDTESSVVNMDQSSAQPTPSSISEDVAAPVEGFDVPEELSDAFDGNTDQSDCGIEVENAVLKYPIGASQRGSLKAHFMKLFGYREPGIKLSYVEALRNISFSVTKGERLGIVGRNGSGKSTLLRTLAGVFPLASGQVSVKGEIGTLLDVSLGFELESTGRENIYNRGLAMGYSKKQMSMVEQDIIDFADLREFIDLPMRTYSSGMFIRLGFAISTQFAPDVLLIDEVFGAGDGVFAHKAVNRMTEMVANSGIVVIVSHDLHNVAKICNRVIWMDRGKIRMDGHPHTVVDAFSADMHHENIHGRQGDAA